MSEFSKRVDRQRLYMANATQREIQAQQERKRREREAVVYTESTLADFGRKVAPLDLTSLLREINRDYFKGLAKVTYTKEFHFEGGGEGPDGDPRLIQPYLEQLLSWNEYDRDFAKRNPSYMNKPRISSYGVLLTGELVNAGSFDTVPKGVTFKKIYWDVGNSSTMRASRHTAGVDLTNRSYIRQSRELMIDHLASWVAYDPGKHAVPFGYDPHAEGFFRSFFGL